MRLIDADALQAVFNDTTTALMREPKLTKDTEHLVRACIMTTEMIKDSPTIETVPVRHGRWEQVDDNKCRCTNCGSVAFIALYPSGANNNYCPNCGAKMDGGNNNA